MALRIMVASAIGGSALWHVEADPQREAKEAVGESLANSGAETAFAEERRAVPNMTDYVSAPYRC